MKNSIIYMLILLVCSCKSTQEPEKKVVVEETPTFSFERCERVHNEVKVRLILSVNQLSINDTFAVLAPNLIQYLQKNFIKTLQNNKDDNKEIDVETLRQMLQKLDLFLGDTLSVEERIKLYEGLSPIFGMIEYENLWYEDELYKPHQMKSFLCFAEGLAAALSRYKTSEVAINNKEIEASPAVDMSIFIKSKTGRYEKRKAVNKEEVFEEREVSDEREMSDEQEAQNTNEKSMDIDPPKKQHKWHPIPPEPEMVPSEKSSEESNALNETNVIDLNSVNSEE